MTINNSTLRFGGILYAIIFIAAFFSQGAVREAMIDWTNPVLTTQTIASNTHFFQLGVLGDLTAFMSDVAISVLLFFILKPVGKYFAAVTAAFRIIAHPAIGVANLLFHYQAGVVSGGLNGFTEEQVESLTMTALQTQHMGYLLAGALFGVHCVLLGIGMYKSGYFSKAHAVIMSIAGLTYMFESYGSLTVPNAVSTLADIVMVFAVVAEMWLLLWLLIPALRRKFNALIKSSTFNLSQPNAS